MSLYTLLCGCLEVQKPTTGSSLGAVVERLRASAAVRGGSLAAHLHAFQSLESPVLHVPS